MEGSVKAPQEQVRGVTLVPVPNIEVKAKDPETGQQLGSATKTDEQGQYRIPGLPLDRVVEVVAEESAAPDALRLAAFARTQRGTQTCDLDHCTAVAAKALELAAKRVGDAGGDKASVLNLDVYNEAVEKAKEAIDQGEMAVPNLRDETDVKEKALEALRRAANSLLSEAEQDQAEWEDAVTAALCFAAERHNLSLPLDGTLIAQVAQSADRGVLLTAQAVLNALNEAGVPVGVAAEYIEQLLQTLNLREDLPQAAPADKTKLSPIEALILAAKAAQDKGQGEAFCQKFSQVVEKICAEQD